MTTTASYVADVREGHVDPLKEFTATCREERKVMLKHV